MYGMEYPKIIHPSGRIKWQMGHMKTKLGHAMPFYLPNMQLKNACTNIDRVLDIKSDRLLVWKFMNR